MPILSRIGRRHPRMRALHAAMYAVLIAGAATMVYPFLLMVAGSTRSAVDVHETAVVPRFLYDRDALYRKHLEGLFNERLSFLQTAYDTDTPGFGEAAIPGVSGGLVEDWERFLAAADLPPTAYALGYVQASVSKTLPLMLRRFKRELIAEYEGDIARMNRALGTEFVNWNAFFLQPEDYLPRRNTPFTTPFAARFDRFKAAQDPAFHCPFSVEGFYRSRFLKTQYTRDIAEYNRGHGTAFASYDEVRLSRTLPKGTAAERSDWETFVRHTLNLLWLRVDDSARPAYQAFLAAKHGSIENLNRRYQAAYGGFGEVPLIAEPPASGIRLSDWNAFITGWADPDTGILHAPPAEALRIHGLDFQFRDYLAGVYGSVQRLNDARGTAFGSFEEIVLPQAAHHYRGFLRLAPSLRREFALRNFAAVIDYLVVHGRGVVNTVIYCVLAVLAALIVNPMAAYALSRHRPAFTYRILLFMLLTMAFPPMVTQIPVFLMLRQLNLLNTFAALVLPGLAHGYSIFLLKGFFDSLPRELYETAMIDGAGEWTMFWQITMSLSKPILAVTALHAFTLAYSNFMFALLICQDEQMWTLMVWLYQLQQRSGQAVLYASLLVASLPTFVIFLFAQRIILRGIVVPVEK